MNTSSSPQAILVVPHLRIQHANAISSPLTHGFPSITAFIGLMWALQRQLTQAPKPIPLRLHNVGVICHHHQEQVAQGFVRTFNLTRNPVDKDGSTAAIVEEGRMHLDITLVFAVSEITQNGAPTTLVCDAHDAMADWGARVGHIIAQMRVAGGSVLPSRSLPGRSTQPWMAIIADNHEERARQFRKWRRTWLPGFALVSRDDLLADRLAHLRMTNPQATLLEAWLHASRFNHQPLPLTAGETPVDGKVIWADPLRAKGSGWTVPIPVGYAALAERHAAGSVGNARDASTPLRFVESVYSLGEWVSPHRLTDLEQLQWYAEGSAAQGLYRCRNDYAATAHVNDDRDDEQQDSGGYVLD